MLYLVKKSIIHYPELTEANCHARLKVLSHGISALRCGALRRRTTPHIDAFTLHALPHACRAAACGSNPM